VYAPVDRILQITVRYQVVSAVNTKPAARSRRTDLRSSGLSRLRWSTWLPLWPHSAPRTMGTVLVARRCRSTTCRHCRCSRHSCSCRPYCHRSQTPTRRCTPSLHDPVSEYAYIMFGLLICYSFERDEL
jgi:hypothetical protein